MDEQDSIVAGLVEDNKNKLEVRCSHCDSIILKPKSADYINQPFVLPLPRQSKTATPEEHEGEEMTDFWVVADMFTFENVGFSHSVGNVKFLVCADCEIGPVGYHDIVTKKCFISLKRVKHV